MSQQFFRPIGRHLIRLDLSHGSRCQIIFTRRDGKIFPRRYFSTKSTTASSSTAEAKIPSTTNDSESKKVETPASSDVESKVTPVPSSAASSSDASPAPEDKPAEEKKTEEKEPRSFGNKVFLAFGGIGGLYLSYLFYKAGFSIKQTEVLLLERFRELPLYWPPGPGVAVTNSKVEQGLLSDNTFDILARYFILTDSRCDGITRDGVLILIDEELELLGEGVKIVDQFIQQGTGDSTERKRRSQVGLAEFVEFIDSIITHLGVPDKKFPERPIRKREDVETDIRNKLKNMMPTTLSFNALTQMSMPSQSMMTSTPSLASTATPATPASSQSGGGWFGSGSTPKTPQPVEPEPDVEEIEILKLELSQYQKKVNTFEEQKKLRGSLTDAESSRLEEWKNEINILEKMIKESK